MNADANHDAESQNTFPDFASDEKPLSILQSLSQTIGLHISLLDINLEPIFNTSPRPAVLNILTSTDQAHKLYITNLQVIIRNLQDHQTWTIDTLFPGMQAGVLPLAHMEPAAFLLAGPVLYSAPDKDFFSKEVKKYGANKRDYLEAVKNLPVVSEGQFQNFLLLLHEITSSFNQPPREDKLQNFHARPQIKDMVVQLQENHNFLAKILDSQGDGICLLEPDLTIRFVNNTIKEWYANQLPLEGQKCHVCCGFESVPCDVCPAKRSLQSGKTEMEVIQGIPGTNVEWLEVYSHPIFDPFNGNITGLIGVLRDISEQKKVKNELLQSKHFTESLLDAIPTPVFFLDTEDRYLGCNRAFSELMGVSSEDIKGKTNQNLWPEKQVEFYNGKNRELLENSRLQMCEYEITDREGRIKPVFFIMNPFHDESGETAGRVGAFLNISDQKKAEQSIKDSEARYRHIFETTSVAVWEEDFSAVKAEIDSLKDQGIQDFERYLAEHPDFVYQAAEQIIVRDVNHTALQVTGASKKEELLGPLSRFLEPEMAGILQKEIIAIARGQVYFEEEVDIHVLDGEPRSILVTISFPSHSDRYDRVLVNTIDISRNKQAEKALRESEERYRVLAEMLPEAVFETDHEMILTYSNQAAYQLFGYTPEEIIGKKMGIDLIDPQDQQRAMTNLMQHINGVDPGSVEYTAIRKDGTRFPILFHASSEFQNGKLAGIRGIIIDISERKQAEEAVHSSEARYRTLVEQSFQGVIIAKDNPLRLVFASKPMETITGYSPQELINFDPEKLALLIHPNDREQFFYNFRRRLQGEKIPPRTEYRFLYRDGSTRWVDIYSTLIEYEGEPATQTAFLDITNRKQMENNLRETNETLQTLIQSSPYAIISLDLEGYVTLWNPTAEKLFGWTEKEVLGKQNPLVQSEDDVGFMDKPAVQQEGIELRLELSRQTKEGKRLDLRLSTAPLYDSTGNVTGVVGIFEDISKQKLAEQEKVIIEEQYRQAHRLEAIGRLAGGVAHDLNNLLTPILLYAEMLLDHYDRSDYSYQPVNEILQAGQRARDLVTQLLAYSRKQNLEYKPIDINTTVEQFQKLLRRTIREDIHIELSLEPIEGMVMADIGQMEQVIMNLAVNAQDAMPEGGTLTLQTEHTVLDEQYAQNHPDVVPGEYIMLAISDTGHGMDDQTRQQIFEPFYTTKGDAGTGLGLSTVYGIVKQHEGHIWVYSEPGIGTCFKIYLPAIQISPREHGIISFEPENLFGNETILLVEDNDQVRKLTFTILKNFGYHVLAAEDGLKALELLKSYQDTIHLLLTDVIMPGMNGRELYESAVQQRPDLRVLYMSGYSNDVIAHRGVLEKGIAFIQKPYSSRGLGARIRELLNEE